MPPKRKQTRKATKANKNKQSSNRDLAEVTRLLRNLNTPKNQVTDLGRMLLSGGNTVSSMFGFPKIFGSGDYTMQNTCWNASSQVPIMHSANESVVIKHREYIADISMAGAPFTLQTFNINPGLSASFPYLSAIASNFQQYRFKGLVFEFKTTSATALVSGTNTAMGSVMLAVQYRSDAPNFATKTQLLNEMWSVDTVPSTNVVLPVECAPAETVLTHQYIRTGGVGTGDIKMFDLGLLSVATQGGQSGQNNIVGELWVSYDVELLKPQLSNSTGGQFFAAQSTSPTSLAPLGGFVNGQYSGNTLSGITLTNTTITFSNLLGPATYLVSVYWQGVGVTFTVPPIIPSAGAVAAVPVAPYNNVYWAPTSGATAAGTAIINYYVNISATGGLLTFGTTGTIPAGGQAYLYINPVPSSSPFA